MFTWNRDQANFTLPRLTVVLSGHTNTDISLKQNNYIKAFSGNNLFPMQTPLRKAGEGNYIRLKGPYAHRAESSPGSTWLKAFSL